MLKKFLTTILAMSAFTMAAGWDYFNPKYAGNAQVRTGVSFDHESKSATPYVNSRFVIAEDLEISAKTTSASVDNVSIKVDILDAGAIAVDLKDSAATAAIQVYKDLDGLSAASELSLNTDGLFQIASEVDTYLIGHIQYAGFTFDSDKFWSPYAGYVYPTDNVELGATYFLVMYESDYITSGWSFDLTFKF